MDIPGLLTSRANLCVQDNIGISNVELSILFSFLIKYRLKILGLKNCLSYIKITLYYLNSPNGQSLSLSCIFKHHDDSLCCIKILMSGKFFFLLLVVDKVNSRLLSQCKEKLSTHTIIMVWSTLYQHNKQTIFPDSEYISSLRMFQL